MAEKEKDELEKMNEALSKSEQFIEKHQKALLIGLAVIVVIIGAIVGVRRFYFEPREKKAEVAMYQAVLAFENDSIDLAINGNEYFMGLQAVADKYGSTDAGKLANAYLGLAYYEKGEYETAIEYLSDFSAKKEYLLTPALSSRIGDCLVELDRFEEAIPYFVEAAQKADNDVYAPIYLQTAANVCEELGNTAEALEYYQEIQSKYPVYYDNNGIERYVKRTESK